MTPKTALVATLITGCLFSAQTTAADAGDWQLAMLHTPSTGQLNAEQRGRVHIYDGLHERDIDSAMSGQFERIEHMMFVRTKVTLPDDTVETQDDEC